FLIFKLKNRLNLDIKKAIGYYDFNNGLMLIRDLGIKFN
ncbi:MAG: hypothetical protein ACI9OE_001252, partial [Mariniflexile sp.]